MTKTSPITRILAAVALAGAVVLVFIVISGSTGSDDDGGKGKPNQNRVGKKQDSGKKEKTKSRSKTYEVQDGDTLTGIAAETGVTVEEIQVLNPDLDPQALIAGQELKLR
ncbi:MAG: LysM peptidoglycan-binding domain-containing protein [Thermoleophilia bacterium]|nr:LysM peptidoglycan-binding domain-containing protein [Thermoleophilia bacterium]